MNDPATYDILARPNQNKDAKEFIPQLVQPMKWKSTEVVLDFGCGSGSVTKNILLPAIQKQMPIEGHLEILGIDISKSAVAHATAEHTHSSIKYQYFDIFRQNWKEFEGKFDKIFSFYALHWIPETTKALERLHKMLKTGGEIGIYCAGMDDLNPAIDEARHDAEFGECFHEFADTREYAKEFKRVGFEVLEVENTTQQFLYENWDSFGDMLMSTGIARVPHGKEEKFRSFAASAFKNVCRPAATPESPTRVRVQIPLVLIRAAKD